MKSKEKYLIIDVLYMTKLSEEELEKLASKLEIKYLNIHPNDFLLNEISHDSYLKLLRYKDLRKIEKTVLEASFKRIEEENNPKTKLFLLNNFKINKRDINKLTKLHLKYKNIFDIFIDESPLHASYLIFGKVINYLNFVNQSVLNGYLCVIPYFRIINEAILLAEYFILFKNVEKGEKALRKWYREGITPSAKELREGKKEFAKKYLDKNFYDLYGEVLFHAHDAQSGEIHNSFRHTRKIISYSRLNPLKINFEYGSTVNFRDLMQIQELIRKNISALTDGFILCFVLEEKIFLPEDVLFVNNFRAKFTTEIRNIDKTFENFLRKFT